MPTVMPEVSRCVVFGVDEAAASFGMARKDAQRFYDRQGDARRGISYSWPL
jgi:hypothetical protein